MERPAVLQPVHRGPELLAFVPQHLLLNFEYLIVSFPLTLIFALLLNEIRSTKFKKVVQTISYLPHFISMVIVAGMIRELLSTNAPSTT